MFAQEGAATVPATAAAIVDDEGPPGGAAMVRWVLIRSLHVQVVGIRRIRPG